MQNMMSHFGCSSNFPTLVLTMLWRPHRSHPPPLSPLMSHILKLWDSVHYSDKFMSHFLPLPLLLNNPLFPLGLKQQGNFPGGPCTPVPHILFLSFFWPSIQETYEALPSECFWYLQLCHWLTPLRCNSTLPFKKKKKFEHICCSRGLRYYPSNLFFLKCSQCPSIYSLLHIFLGVSFGNLWILRNGSKPSLILQNARLHGLVQIL